MMDVCVCVCVFAAGDLPAELGRLTKLEELLLNSNAFSGEECDGKPQCYAVVLCGRAMPSCVQQHLTYH